MAKQQRTNKRGGGPQKPRQGARAEEETSGGGFLSSMRSGIQNVAGTGAPKKRTAGSQIWNILFWVAIAVFAATFVYRRLM